MNCNVKNKEYHDMIVQLEKELLSIKQKDLAILSMVELAIDLCVKVMIKLRKRILADDFERVDCEIYFFKYIKPLVNSKLIFYVKLFEIEVHKTKGNTKAVLKYYKKTLMQLEGYFKDNFEFCLYYWRQQTHMDHLFFVRKEGSFRIHIDSIFHFIDPQFSTGYDQTLASIIAHDNLIKFVKNEIEKILSHTDKNLLDEENCHSDAIWTGSNVALVELIYALHSAKVINNGDFDLKELAKLFGKMFNANLDEFYRTFTDIQIRKKCRTKFLNHLIDSLNRKMDEMNL